MDEWFRRHAWQNHAAGITRTNVVCDASSGEITGYVSLSAGQIERAFLPKSQQRNRPDPIPITLLARLAVHIDYQKRGLAQRLLFFALSTALRASREVGSFGVLTHPLDDEVQGFYARWGFVQLPFDPERGMFVRMSDLERFDFG